MKTQAERASEFRALHQQSQPFVIPNAFDAGTARLLESFG
jgi:2-methylisocitrate lyase-like PEP mutase family enzyme